MRSRKRTNRSAPKCINKSAPILLQPEKPVWPVDSLERFFTRQLEKRGPLSLSDVFTECMDRLGQLASDKVIELIAQGREELSRLAPSDEVMYTVDILSAHELNLFSELVRALEAEALKRGLPIPPAQGSPMTAPAVPPQVDKAMEPEVAKRRAIVRQNTGKSIPDICKLFDGSDYPVPLPREWDAEFGVRTWAQAYANERLRQRVQTLISKDRRATK